MRSYGRVIRNSVSRLGKLSLRGSQHGNFYCNSICESFPERVESLTLMDFLGVQTIRPSVLPMYSLMSWENRVDRWKTDSSNPNPRVNGKTWSEYKEAIMSTPSGWFKKGSKSAQILHHRSTDFEPWIQRSQNSRKVVARKTS